MDQILTDEITTLEKTLRSEETFTESREGGPTHEFITYYRTYSPSFESQSARERLQSIYRSGFQNRSKGEIRAAGQALGYPTEQIEEGHEILDLLVLQEGTGNIEDQIRFLSKLSKANTVIMEGVTREETEIPYSTQLFTRPGNSSYSYSIVPDKKRRSEAETKLKEIYVGHPNVTTRRTAGKALGYSPIRLWFHELFRR